MPDIFTARASVIVQSPLAHVWDALVTPAMIKQYVPVTEVISGWEPDSPIVWKATWLGEPRDVEGTILRLEPGHLLEYEYFDPLPAKVRRQENREHRDPLTDSCRGCIKPIS